MRALRSGASTASTDGVRRGTRLKKGTPPYGTRPRPSTDEYVGYTQAEIGLKQNGFDSDDAVEILLGNTGELN